MPQSKYYSILIVPDGVESSMGIKMRAWVFKALVTMFALLMVGLIIFFSFYGKILVRASKASELMQENEELKRYKYKLGLLEENMKETRKLVTRISGLAGVDFKIPELPPDSVIFAEMVKTKPAVLERSSNINVNTPEGLPVDGFITRGFSIEGEDYHPGVDIAGEIGTPILATGAGMVSFVGEDSVYGNMVIIDHENGLSTIYGHNSEILVELGQEVLLGSRIALMGSSGKSTAPHLHYELRKEEKPVNPLKYMSEYEILSKQE